MKVEIEIPVGALKSVLTGIGKVIGRPCVPVLGCAKVNCDRNGEVQIHATNLEDYVTANLGKCSGSSNGELLVPFEDLSKIVRRCSGSQSVRLVGNDKETEVRYPIGNIRKVEFVAVNEWPSTPEIRGAGIALSDELKDCIRESLDCSSEDPSRTIIQSACLDVQDPKAHYVVGTNGSILYSANTFRFDLKQSLVIPNRKFLQWGQFWEDGHCELSTKPIVKKKEGWVQLKSNRWTFITRQLDGTYPNWKPVIPRQSPATTMQINPDAVQMLLNALPKMPGADGQHKSVSMVVHENNLLLQARQSDSDNWTTLPVVHAKVSGKPIHITLNRDYLIKALRFGLLDVELMDDRSPLVFKNEGKKLIVMPVRPEAVPKPESQPHPAPLSAAESSETETSRERNSMPRTVNRIEQHQSEQAEETNQSSFEQLQGQIEGIKDTLRGVISQLNETLKIVAQAQKEKRITEREIQSTRKSLREVQRIEI
jgi:DNA polymerase III sliding clamp (beta) subunit (PCNA family)